MIEILFIYSDICHNGIIPPYELERIKMQWLTIVDISGIFIAFGLLFFLIKELKTNIKDSNDGEASNKCGLV